MSIARPASVRTPVDARGRLHEDVPCMACGYDLRGIEATHTCPECGTPVEMSLDRWRRRDDPLWRRRLLWGVDLILAAMGLAAVLALASPLMTTIIGISPAGMAEWRIVSLEAPLGLALAGCWMFTQAPTLPSRRGNAPAMRWPVRYVGILTFVAAGAAVALGLPTPTPGGALVIARRILLGVSLLAAIVCVLVGGAYVRDIAQRIDAPELASMAWVVAWADGLIGVNILTGYIVINSLANSPVSGMRSLLGVAMGCGVCATAAAMLFFGLVSVVLLARLRVLLARDP